MPMDKRTTNKTLDYAFDDWCVAQIANALNKQNEYEHFFARLKNYRNNFHPDFRFFIPKDCNRQWQEGYSPFDNYCFIEGNGWQYSIYVPHGIPGVVAIMGRDLFN